MPFKLNQSRRHHIPKQKRKVMNWREYDASLRQRGSLTVWFSDAAIEGWRATPRTTRGGQPWYSPLAILTALTLRAVFSLALRQAEGLITSIIHLLGLDLAVPDHTTLCRRAETLEVPRPRPRSDGEPVHLLVDSTGLKLCGAGEWLIEKHGTRTRRSWRKLHLGVDADTGQIVAAVLTDKDADDGAQVGPLLDQVAAPVISFTADGAYDQEGVAAAVAGRHREAAVIVPPRSTAVPSETAATAPTLRDRHLQCITEHGRAAWQKTSGYTTRARVEATIVSRDNLDPWFSDNQRHIHQLHPFADRTLVKPEAAAGGGLKGQALRGFGQRGRLEADATLSRAATSARGVLIVAGKQVQIVALHYRQVQAGHR